MTTDERIENLEKGLASARRLNRWLLAAVGLALGVWILAGTFGPATAGAPGGEAAVNEVLRAKRFVLVDDAGKTRALLHVDAPGPVLDLRDAAGKTRAMLVVGKDGSVLVLANENGKGRALLNVLGDVPILSLLDENDKLRATLHVNKNGPVLNLYDGAGKTIWQAP